MALDFPIGVDDGYKYEYIDPDGALTVYIWKAAENLWYSTSAAAAGGGIEEAPEDGKIYGRQDAAWTELAGGGGSGTDGIITGNPIIQATNQECPPATLTVVPATVVNAELSTKRWLKDGVEISADDSYEAVTAGTYQYEERWIDEGGNVLKPSALKEITPLVIAAPSITGVNDGATDVIPSNTNGTQTIFLIGSIPSTTTKTVGTWGNAEWELALDQSFTSQKQSRTVAISSPTGNQAGPTNFVYHTGRTYYVRVRYTAVNPTGQQPSNWSDVISFSTIDSDYDLDGSTLLSGQTETYTITTTNYADGTKIYWSQSEGEISPSEGEVTVNSNTASIDLTGSMNASDSTFSINLYSDSARSDLLYTESFGFASRLVWVDRSTLTVNSGYNETKPGSLGSGPGGRNGSTEFTAGWGHGGNNTDRIVINVSGSGTYNLRGLSMGTQGGEVSSYYVAVKYRVESGTAFGSGSVIYEESTTVEMRGNSSQPDWVEMLFSNKSVTLNRGQNYVIGYSLDLSNTPSNSTRRISGGPSPSTYDIITASGSGATLTVTDAGDGSSAPAPWNTSNGTGATSGQIPIILINI